MSGSRLLIVITRMYAEHCGDGDEFTEVWGGPDDCEKPYLIFPQQPEGQERMVLVIHGYDYPDSYGAEVFNRAVESIRPALNGLGAKDRDIGIVLHPSQDWETSEVSALARELQAELMGDGNAVKFVTDYRNRSRLQTHLADLCREGLDFSEEFDHGWEKHAAGDSVYDSRMGEIRHKMVYKLGPLQRDLEGWRELDFDRETGRELFKIYGGGKAQQTLNSVRDLIAQSTQHTNTVENVVSAAKLREHDDKWKGEVESSFAKLKGLCTDDPSYVEVAKVFTLFGDGRPAGRSDADLQELQELLTAKNHVQQWYEAVLAAFDELRKVIVG